MKRVAKAVEKRWCRYWGRKKNNKGSSIVTVLVAMSLVLILVTILMSVTLVNFRMKSTNLGSQKNFYTAENALEEIRAGLAEELADAVAAAYVDTVEKYGVLDQAGRKDNYEQVFMEQLKNKIGYQESDGSYPVSHLESLLKETKFHEDTQIGAQVSSTAGGNHANIDITEADLTLKNVIVTYQDEAAYVTQIRTDIRLSCPKVDFSESSAMPDITSFALIAGDCLKLATGRDCRVTGNAYLGENPTVVENARLDITKSPAALDRGLAVTGSMLKEGANASVNISGMEVWAKELAVDSSRFLADDTALYLRNDFIISNSLLTSAKALVSGEFYGYGDLKTAASAAWTVAEADEIKKNPAGYSSSVILNGIRSSLDFSGLSAMKISGNSYINGRQYEGDYGAYGNMNTEDVKMGESLSIRSDQIAYLVPAECIAPQAKEGGTNPMPIAQYSALLTELEKTYGSDGEKYLVDLACETKKYGVPLNQLGVNGWQLEAHQVNGTGIGSLVYVFLKFDSTKSVNAFFRNYYDRTDAAKLGELLDLYSGSGIKLPDEVLNGTADDGFYYNGNILASGASSLYVPDRLVETSADAAAWNALKAEETLYQNQFQALNRKLLKDASAMTESEKQKGVYDNLVKNMVTDLDPAYAIGSGSMKSFVKTTGEAAVVVNGDYEINSENLAKLKMVPDMEGVKHSDAELAVVIASGDITVTQNFKGLLIAGGKIIVTKDAKLTADSGASGKALLAGNADGIRVYDYLVSGESYAVAGDAEGIAPGSLSKGSIEMLGQVTYENWSRQ